MLFNDQDVIVLSHDGGTELDAGQWSDDLDNIARLHGGYAVVINSDPADIVADYRDGENAGYIRRVTAALANPASAARLALYLTAACTECGDRVSDMADGQAAEHVIADGNVIIGCEGYWLIDPNLIGMSEPDWQDWTKGA